MSGLIEEGRFILDLEAAADEVLQLDLAAQRAWEHSQQQESDASRLMGKILYERAEDTLIEHRDAIARQFSEPLQTVPVDLIARYSAAADLQSKVEAADPGSATQLMLTILARDAEASYNQAYDQLYGGEE